MKKITVEKVARDNAALAFVHDRTGIVYVLGNKESGGLFITSKKVIPFTYSSEVFDGLEGYTPLYSGDRIVITL